MQRLVLSATCFLLLAGVALSAPARPLYQPEPRPVAPPPVFLNLNGTWWAGKYLTINRTFILEPNGTLSYSTNGKNVVKNRGSWRLQGNVLVFDYWTSPTNKLMQFRGTITDPNTITGEQVILRTNQRIPTTMRKTR